MPVGPTPGPAPVENPDVVLGDEHVVESIIVVCEGERPTVSP